MGLLIRLIFSSRNRIISIVALVALGAIIDSRLPNGILDRKSASNVESSIVMEESALCIQTLYDFSITMLDYTKALIDDPNLTVTSAVWDSPACTAPADAKLEDVEDFLAKCFGTMADGFNAAARSMRHLREQALVQSPPVCASDLPPFPVVNYSKFKNGENADNTDYVIFEEDLRRTHEQFLNYTDMTIECLGEMEREILQIRLTSMDEFINSDDSWGGEKCKQEESARIIYNEQWEAVREFMMSLDIYRSE